MALRHTPRSGRPTTRGRAEQGGGLIVRLIAADAPEAIDLAVAALRRGELIGIPTETVYGVVALPSGAALGRLISAKQRALDKGIQLLVDSIEQVRAMAIVSTAAERLAARLWPGGLTLVLERRPDVELSPLLGGGRSTIGLRLPDHHVPRALARVLGPIAASSANMSGQPDAASADLVALSFGDDLALIIDDGPVRGGTPSTVVDCSLAGQEPRILRAGAISAAAISAALAQE